jgi:hypothetical protein
VRKLSQLLLMLCQPPLGCLLGLGLVGKVGWLGGLNSFTAAWRVPAIHFRFTALATIW